MPIQPGLCVVFYARPCEHRQERGGQARRLGANDDVHVLRKHGRNLQHIASKAIIGIRVSDSHIARLLRREKGRVYKVVIVAYRWLGGGGVGGT